MTVTMAPGASSGCTKAYPIAIDAPTTSPSHGDTSSVHGESPRPIPEKRYVLNHPGLHQPAPVRLCNGLMVMVMVVYRGPGLPTLAPSTTTAPASLHVVGRGA